MILINKLLNSGYRLLLPVVALAIVGCTSAPSRTPLPLEFTNQAEIPGVPRARFWGDEWPQWSQDEFATLNESEFRERFGELYDAPHNYLAISGGGAEGAFGAGLLVGWTANGTRPRFSIVTGISTGALTAPFAFLGSDYDDVLKQVYTTTKTEDIARRRRLREIFKNDAVSDTRPLRELIEKLVNEDIITAIAEEHRAGRRLFVGTVNLDASRSVIWNIGGIAVSDYPRRIALIHDILQASSAIPVAFPPVVIPVDVGSETYDEMHVDGGTGAQVFVYPAAVDFREVMRKLKVHGQPKVYVLRNAYLEPDYRGVQRTVLPIASRSISSLIRNQGIGDIYQIHSLCTRDGADFNLAYIPSDFTDEASEAFDPVYMTALFERGYEMGSAGYDWKKAPPGYLTLR